MQSQCQWGCDQNKSRLLMENVTLLEDILKTNDEKVIQKYLEAHPLILKMVIGTPEFAFNFVLPQFQIGMHGRADFIVVTGQSSSYEVTIVELKLPMARLYNKDNTLSKSLNKADTQIYKYKNWILNNEDEFRGELTKRIRILDHKFSDNFDWTRRLHIKSAVFIGRRNALTQAARDRNVDMKNKGISVISYDRLVDAEKWIVDKSNQGISLNDLYGQFERVEQYREEVERKHPNEEYGNDDILFLGNDESVYGYHGFYKDILRKEILDDDDL